MNLLEIRDSALELGVVCDHCLGRQAAQKFKGHESAEIGAALKTAKTEKEIEANLELKQEVFESPDCVICKGVFLKIDGMLPSILEKMNEYEFNNFLVGSRVSQSVITAEEELWARVGVEYCESIKQELNRLVGKKISEITGKEAEFEEPDVLFIVDYVKGKVLVQANSLFIYGRYKKFERGLPQTKWPCRACRGRGCKECEGTGKQYKETVEEIIAQPVLEVTGASEQSFHGAGREDRDARMLGEGRPFVLEVKKPRKRNVNLNELESEINRRAVNKVEVKGLRLSSKKEVQYIKRVAYDKTYESIIECKGVTEEDLKKMEAGFSGVVISQKTPTRVLHRRADKVRKRKVISMKCEKISDDCFKATVTAEAGTYIKELISGDQGRTAPSVSELIGKSCVCKELDVVRIHLLEGTE